MIKRTALVVTLGLALGLGCSTVDSDPSDGADDNFATGKADGAISSLEALAVLALVNDHLVNAVELDDDARLYKTAAYNIIGHRNGPDGVVGTADDDAFDDLNELDAVKYVGKVALERLLEYAISQGYLDRLAGKTAEVIFSPQPYANSHNVRVAALIDGATKSVDIAVYSYSDALIGTALENAVNRGVKIRFIFETANDDRKKTGTDLENSKSARLERLGINVRYVNKIMHHKYMIVDGPRDDINDADSAWVVSGSGNWSNGAATRYDENTLFLRGHREVTLRMQAEFNHLWAHSRDFIWDDTLPYELSGLTIERADIQDGPSSHALFTSDNFDLRATSPTTFRVTGRNTVSDGLVDAIGRATTSIYIASGHLRSRPVAEAIIAKKAANPGMDIRVYLDGQEYISSWYHGEQLRDLADCVEVAGTSASKLRKCYDSGFYFGYQVGQAGVTVRYKYYSYRWHYSYAKQMHNKYAIFDGSELWTGSYNLSNNAEHNTMENMIVLRGAEFADVVAAYTNNFLSIWDTGRADNKLADLRDEVQNASSIPLVFDSMSLSWDEVASLKSLIYSNCSAINTTDYRTNPQNHWYCPR